MTIVLRFAPALAMVALLAAGWALLRPRTVDAPATGLTFTDEAAAAGADNEHRPCTLAPAFANIMPWLTAVGAVVAAGDCDGDGWVDLYVANNARNAPNRLFRNRGDGTFADVAAAAGVADCNGDGATMDAVFFDCDNDGDQDLFVARWAAPNLLFLNRGDGVFSPGPADGGLDVWGYPSAACVFDYDRDGLPDIYLGNYFASRVVDPATGETVPNDLWHPTTTRVMHETTVNARNGGRNVLFRNLGGGRFTDVTVEAGLEYTGWTLDVGHGDLDNDGWPDLYVANDYGPDNLYLNTGAEDGPVRFRSVTDPRGHPGLGRDWWKGMNVDMADVDGNGFLDIYVANILVPGQIVEGNMLWMGTADRDRPGGLRYRNLSQPTGTMDGGWGWAARFGDFNNDGLTDIFAANGFVSGPDPDHHYWFALQELSAQHKTNIVDAAHWLPMEDMDLAGHQSSRLFLQLRPRTGQTLPAFADVAGPAGIIDRRDGRGVAVIDYDRDGDLDLYVANQKAPACLYRNHLRDEGPTGGDGGHWLGFRLVGDPERPLLRGGRTTASTRDAFGARLTLYDASGPRMQEMAPTNGFSSQSEARLHFGVESPADIDSVVVRWPSGRRQTVSGRDLAPDREHLWVENGNGPEPLPSPRTARKAS